MMNARRPLAPMVSYGGKTLIARSMGSGDECFKKVVLPGCGHQGFSSCRPR